MTDYIQSELLVLIPVLYLTGCGLKKSNIISDKYIPIILGISGVMICFCYFMFNDVAFNGKSIFAAITQGILCAGASTYANQIYKQIGKDE